ncbi:MAG: hypothetical protein L7H18_02960 [Candidatus Nealsonbacteria bacterium DGGOD1a]|jgi:hypothetical protein|nr:MAG: hypothetical protein L7H18_02960 [Candidatus Nealsonbacteria bacterium DGGOD1a]
MTKSTKIIIAVVITTIVVIGALALTGPRGENNQPVVTTPPTNDEPANVQSETPPAATTGENQILETETTIDEDLADIDARMTGLNEDNANIETGLNDASGDTIVK